MKLTVHISEAAGVPGGRAILLCDYHGEPLPMQISHVLEQGVGESSILTVKFVIDGKEISLL